jgi:hypothetical protein
MKRFFQFGPLLLVTMLAACGPGRTDLVSVDPCYEDFYHGFRDRDGFQQNMTVVHNQLLRPDAPPGCSSQSSTNYADGPGAIAMKTVLPAAIQAAGLVGYGAVLRPPQYNSNMSVSAGGAQFAAGAVAGGAGGMAYNTNANLNANSASAAARANPVNYNANTNANANANQNANQNGFSGGPVSWQ